MLLPWQARASEFHPYMVAGVDALPQSLQAAAKAAIPPGVVPGRALVAPPDFRPKGLLVSRAVPEQALLFTDSGVLHVQGAGKGEAAPPPVFIRLDSLLYMRSSHLLLYGRAELFGAVNGKPAALDMEFNAIGWRLMDLEWRRMVGQIIGLPPLDPDALRAEGEHERALLQMLPAKFAGGLYRYGLYTGETLLGAVFQPAVWTQRWALFNQQLAPNILLALTNASVLVIAEEKALVRKGQQYGWIITRMPRQTIAAVQAGAQDALQELTFSLSRSGAMAERRLQLEPETVQSWMEIWGKK